MPRTKFSTPPIVDAKHNNLPPCPFFCKMDLARLLCSIPHRHALKLFSHAGFI